MNDLRLTGGTVVLPDGAQRADVLVDDGRIAGVIAPGADAPAAETLDVTGRHVLPGVVDAHVHLGADITSVNPALEPVACSSAYALVTARWAQRSAALAYRTMA